MKKSFQIANVRPILNIDKPIVVFELTDGNAIVRNPKQALTDLQNSGRALGINPRAFANGVEGADAKAKEDFISALFDCNNAVGTGDITNTKAGDKYVVRAGHPALTDASHAQYGKVKEGESLVAEKDGVWVEGFLSIPLTEQEKMRRDVSGTFASALMAMYGFNGGAQVAQSAPASLEASYSEVNDLPQATTEEAFGKQGGK